MSPPGTLALGRPSRRPRRASLVDPVLAARLPVALPGLRPATCDQPSARAAVRAVLVRAAAPSRSALCACGVPLPPGARRPAAAAAAGSPPFARGASLGPYEGALRIVVHELKFRGRRRVAARLAEALLGQRPARAGVPCDGADVLVPVPLHPRRRRERGFNQSALLARALGRRRRACASPRTRWCGARTRRPRPA